MVDALFVVPGNAKGVYQALSEDYSAVETPTWALLLAESCRSVNYNVAILDITAERLSHLDALKRINECNPRFIVFVVYGQNVNAGTANMSGAVALSNYVKDSNVATPIIYIGSHVQALPIDSLEKERSIDIVCTNEGVYSLRNLLGLEKIDPVLLSQVKGIGYRVYDTACLTDPEKVVPQERCTSKNVG